MNEKLNDALNEISGRHIEEAIKPKKKKKIYWLGAAAALLAIVIILNSGGISVLAPALVQADTISEAADSRIVELNEERSNRDEWLDYRNRQIATVDTVQAQLQHFFADTTSIYLSESDSNQLYSPVNLYMGLAMVAELAGGQSRQQILDLLGTADIETLRTQASAVWESAYVDGNDKCILANSLWLDDTLTYKQSVMDDIAYHYYASVYRTNFGTEETTMAIQNWLNENTHGLLKDAVDGVDPGAETLLALYSTIYFYAKWYNEFSAINNTTDIFHAPGGDITVTYMNKKESPMSYFWGDSFGAVGLSLKNGSTMWFILPDDGKTVDDVLAEGQYMEMVLNGYDWENRKDMKVNLSVPKFDVKSQSNLKSGLEELGVTDIFDPDVSDFSDSIAGDLFFAAVNQAVRVKIDEDGVEAAAYVEFPGYGTAMPPEEIIDFILDRPFLFVISKDDLPLFAGVVNEP